MGKTVVVLGCGPAGLFAAQAAVELGYGVAIISQKKKSVIYGAQYLHKPIPGLMENVSSFRIRTLRYGVPERYAQRVYQDASMPTSWAKAQPVVEAWDLREAYENAWKRFEGDIMDTPIDADTIDELSSNFDLVISTIPAWSICRSSRHNFPSLPIMVKKSVEFQIEEFDVEKSFVNWVIYNGTTEGIWYRCSTINGFESTESQAHPALAEEGGWDLGFKILDTDCDCHPNLVKTGRMGKWKRGVLTHHAFEDTLAALSDRFGIAGSERP